MIYVVVLAIAAAFLYIVMVGGGTDPNLAALVAGAVFTGGVVIRLIIRIP